MVNITHKIFSLRKAIASATVTVSQSTTIDAIKNRKVPKGDVFEFARAAGLLAIKKTSDVIPDCHPLPVEYAAITYEVDNMSINISVEVHTIYKTGVEVEAMHGASITALTIYDMLKPIDKDVQISSIKLLSKSGGKSGFKLKNRHALKCAVIVCSDRVSSGINVDESGKVIINKLEAFDITASAYQVIPDEVATIRSTIAKLESDGYGLAILTGGTGLSHRDVTPEAVEPMITKMIPGVMEFARSYGQERTPFAMLSRSIAGFMNNMLILTLPGSHAGASETIDALFPHILHVLDVADETSLVPPH